MTFKPALWYPIAVALSILNLVAVGAALAQQPPEPLHASVHVALALAFGLWAQRLRRAPIGPLGSDLQGRLEALDALEIEVSRLGQELGEVQERLDFTERLLAQEAETRRVGPQP
jgi:hypothetical protein